MINAEQIRAARALLDWSTAELATQTGLTVNGINKIERGHVQAHRDTLESIQRVFEKGGLEFLDFNGVRRRPEGINILEGQVGFERFYELVFDYISKHGGTICVSGVDESQFAKYHGEAHAKAHLFRMTELLKKRQDIQFKLLIKEGDLNFMASSYAIYRWQSKEQFSPTPFYVFGENLALITFDTHPAPKIMIISSATFASAYRQQFEVVWNAAKEPSVSKAI